MRTNATKVFALIVMGLGAALCLAKNSAADEDDPPGRVARLGYLQNEVSFEPAGTEDWVSAHTNRPVTTGDQIWTDRGARAELQLGSAAIRLDGETGFSFLNLDDSVTQIRITEGTISLRVRDLDADEVFEIDTPNIALSILSPGSYRVNVNEGGDTTIVTVRDGEGEVAGGGRAFSVNADEVGTFTGFDEVDGYVERTGRGDDFDTWCARRDLREDRSESARYVSTDVTGYQDLDDNGGWRPVPEYGTVWFPHTTVVDWAPYRYGNWVWISPWGWTWVDDAPWGFAPFHYGRWVVVRGSWGWVPSPPRPRRGADVAYVRPVYAPALVAWVGGPRWGAGDQAGGGVAWFPLGPREVFIPSYHVSRNYVTSVNVTNTTVNNTYVTNVYNTYTVNKTVTDVRYVNQSAPDGVTATSRAAFTSAQHVGRDRVRVDLKETASAPVSPSVAVPPQRRSVLGASSAATVKPPVSVRNRAVVAKATPPRAPVPFAKQEQAIQANGGTPLAISEARALDPEAVRTSAPVKIALPAKRAAPRTNIVNRPERPPQQGRPAAPDEVAPGRISRPVPPPPAPDEGAPGRIDRPVSPPPAPDRRQPAVNRPPARVPADAAAAPASANAQLENKQQQELQNLHQRQDKERQRIEQQQRKNEQLMQNNSADGQRQQQAQQKHQQQLEQLEQKHQEQQQKLQQKQEQAREKKRKAAKP